MNGGISHLSVAGTCPVMAVEVPPETLFPIPSKEEFGGFPTQAVVEALTKAPLRESNWGMVVDLVVFCGRGKDGIRHLVQGLLLREVCHSGDHQHAACSNA